MLDEEPGGRLLPFDDPSDYVRIRRRVQRLWEEGEFSILVHARKRMKERKVDVLDLQHVVKYGRVTGHSRPRGNWRHTLSGTSVDGRPLGCQIEIEGRLVVVTVIVHRRVSKRR